MAASEPLSMKEVMERLQQRCQGTGVTCHPFQLGWYHEKVSTPYHFPYSNSTLAVVLISTPSMFERLFKPFLTSPNYSHSSPNPLEQCFRYFFSKLRELFPSNKDSIQAIHDFEMSSKHNGPQVLVQTAGHVAGVACYYQRIDVNPDPWPKERKIYGVSVHPKYGGWFAFRGVLIFPGVSASTLTKKEPPDCVPSHKMRVNLLERFNENWQDMTYRDVMVDGPQEKYSEQQKQFFSTDPTKRGPLIEEYISEKQ